MTTANGISAVAHLLKQRANTASPKIQHQRPRPYKIEGSVIQAVKTGMEQHPNNASRAAKFIHINKSHFSIFRKLVILQDRVIPQECRDQIEDIIKYAETNKRLDKATRKKANDLITEYFKFKDPRHIIEKRQRRLDQTLIHIRESCESSKDMEIPNDLSQDDIRKAIATLAASTVLIGKLMRRLTGEENEEN
jgi:hypothetical protein